MAAKYKKVLVIGSSGFIGSNLVKTLIDKGNYVVGIDTLDGQAKIDILSGSVTSSHPIDKEHRIPFTHKHFLSLDITYGNIGNNLNGCFMAPYDYPFIDFYTIFEVLAVFNPDEIIHCAAYFNKESSIDNREATYAFNTKSVDGALSAIKEANRLFKFYKEQSWLNTPGQRTPYIEIGSASPYHTTYSKAIHDFCQDTGLTSYDDNLCYEDPKSGMNSIVISAANTLEPFFQLNSLTYKNPRFIYISSTDVYGNYVFSTTSDNKSHERTLLEPSTPYASATITAENMIRTSGIPDLNYLILRAPKCYGYRQKEMTAFIEEYMNSRKLIPIEKGYRDWLFIDDLADTILTIIDTNRLVKESSDMFSPEPTYISTMNVSTNMHVSYAFVYKEILNQLNCLINNTKEPLFSESDLPYTSSGLKSADNIDNILAMSIGLLQDDQNDTQKLISNIHMIVNQHFKEIELAQSRRETSELYN